MVKALSLMVLPADHFITRDNLLSFHLNELNRMT